MSKWMKPCFIEASHNQKIVCEHGIQNQGDYNFKEE